MPDAAEVERLRRVLYELAGEEDDEFAADMLEAFLESLAESVNHLRDAHALAPVARAAHRLKSSFATLGLDDGARACALLEICALDGDAGKAALARTLVDQHRQYAEQLVEALLREVRPTLPDAG